MIIETAHDGDLFSPGKFSRFHLDEKSDINAVRRFDSDSGTDLDLFDFRLNFVGFVTDEKDDMLAVFPKNFSIHNVSSDAKLVFQTIARYSQRRHTDFIGQLSDEKWETSFPFAAFFSIYSYYQKHGLFFETKEVLRNNAGGKINWKETIRQSDKYISHDKLVFYPFLYKKTKNVFSFLTQCMIFSIDYTAIKFGELLDVQPIEYEMPNFDIYGHKEAIVNELLRIREATFRDDYLKLIDALIAFFGKINYGGRYYLKHYTFSSIWEDSTRRYLSRHFNGIIDDTIQLSPSPKASVKFEKKSFNPNEAVNNEYFQPDCYVESGDTQFIFDAKYYSNSRGIMYKELAYVLLLKDIRDFVKSKPKFAKTSCAVILPSTERKTFVNFKMNPTFNSYYANIKIMEEYFDIRDVLIDYLDGNSLTD